jgi:hypothetical protein
MTFTSGAIGIDAIGHIGSANSFTVGSQTELTAWAIDNGAGNGAALSGGYRYVDGFSWTWDDSSDWGHVGAVFDAN